MTLQQFRDSLQREEPPSALSFALAGLWWDAKGDWKQAHASAQQDEGLAGSWVHAYLHRKEGDSSNAGYWNGRAHKAPAQSSLEQEWHEITDALLSEGPYLIYAELASWIPLHRSFACATKRLNLNNSLAVLPYDGFR
jgi:hypothetical protein